MIRLGGFPTPWPAAVITARHLGRCNDTNCHPFGSCVIFIPVIASARRSSQGVWEGDDETTRHPHKHAGVERQLWRWLGLRDLDLDDVLLSAKVKQCKDFASARLRKGVKSV